MIVFKEILKNINPITYNTHKIPYLIYKIQGKIPGHMNSNNINKKDGFENAIDAAFSIQDIEFQILERINLLTSEHAYQFAKTICLSLEEKLQKYKFSSFFLSISSKYIHVVFVVLEASLNQ